MKVMATQNNQANLILFFSNYCAYSKEVLTVITRKNIRNAFVLICIDSVQNIPPFVDRVPLIVDKHSKQMFADEDIAKILEIVASQMYPPVSIEAMPSSFMGGPTNFETDYENPLGGAEDNFNMLDMDNFRIQCTNEGEEVKVKKADSSLLEQYIAQRDADIKIVADRPMIR